MGNDLIVATFLKQNSSVVCLQIELCTVIRYKSVLRCEENRSERVGLLPSPRRFPTGVPREAEKPMELCFKTKGSPSLGNHSKLCSSRHGNK